MFHFSAASSVDMKRPYYIHVSPGPPGHQFRILSPIVPLWSRRPPSLPTASSGSCCLATLQGERPLCLKKKKCRIQYIRGMGIPSSDFKHDNSHHRHRAYIEHLTQLAIRFFFSLFTFTYLLTYVLGSKWKAIKCLFSVQFCSNISKNIAFSQHLMLTSACTLYIQYVQARP